MTYNANSGTFQVILYLMTLTLFYTNYCVKDQLYIKVLLTSGSMYIDYPMARSYSQLYIKVPILLYIQLGVKLLTSIGKLGRARGSTLQAQMCHTIYVYRIPEILQDGLQDPCSHYYAQLAMCVANLELHKHMQHEVSDCVRRQAGPTE